MREVEDLEGGVLVERARDADAALSGESVAAQPENAYLEVGLELAREGLARV